MWVLEDLKLLEEQFSGNFAKIISPECIRRHPNCIKEERFRSIHICSYSGIAQIGSTIVECLMREIISEGPIIIDIASSEVCLFQSKRRHNPYSLPIFVAFEVINESHVKYTSVTRQSLSKFNDFIDSTYEEKLLLVKNLIISLSLMQKENCYYLGLNPEYISINSDLSVIFDYPFLADSGLISRHPEELLEFFSDNCLAPEVLTIKKYSKYEFINRIDPPKAQIFSLGMLVCYLFNKKANLSRINFNKVDSISFFNYFVPLSDAVDTHELVEPLFQEISNLRSEIYHEISLLRHPGLGEQCCDAMKLRMFDRSELKFWRRSFRISKRTQFRDIEDIQFNQFCRAVQEFEELIKTVYSTNNYSVIKKSVGRILDTQRQYLEEGYNRYLSSRCNSESVQAIDGISYFLYNFLRDLGDYSYLKLLMKTVKSYGIVPYQSALKDILNYDSHMQDYLLTGLCLIDIERDWSFFFPHQLIKQTYSRLSCHPKIREELRLFLIVLGYLAGKFNQKFIFFFVYSYNYISFNL